MMTTMPTSSSGEDLVAAERNTEDDRDGRDQVGDERRTSGADPPHEVSHQREREAGADDAEHHDGDDGAGLPGGVAHLPEAVGGRPDRRQCQHLRHQIDRSVALLERRSDRDGQAVADCCCDHRARHRVPHWNRRRSTAGSRARLRRTRWRCRAVARRGSAGGTGAQRRSRRRSACRRSAGRRGRS